MSDDLLRPVDVLEDTNLYGVFIGSLPDALVGRGSAVDYQLARTAI